MTNVMFYGVTHWNTFMSAILYITDTSLQPLQVVLRGIIAGTEQRWKPPNIPRRRKL